MTSIFDDIKSSFSRGNNALHQIIFINVVVFAILVVLRTIMTMSGSAGGYAYLMTFLSVSSNLDIFLYRPWTLFTYFFTHEQFLHIIFNLLNLYWFGMLVREYLGDKRLVNLYVLGGLAGGIFYLITYNTIPYLQVRADNSFMMGASGSVIAIMVAAATLLPNYTFNLLLFGPVRIKYIAAVMVLLSISGATGGNAGGNIAHLGGAILGFVYIKQLQSGSDWGRPVQAVLDFFRGIFSQKSPLKVTYKNPNRPFSASSTSASSAGAAVPGSVTPSQDEIDLILDKISNSGYESLTKEEKQKLFRASQK